MHYSVFVMIGPKTDINTGVEKALAPFDENRAVKPHRDYIDRTELRMMSGHYGIDPANLHELVRLMPDWKCCPGGVDRRGLYALSTANPDGYWDWYRIGGRWAGRFDGENVAVARELLKAPYLEDSLPYYVLTPEGEWLEHERYYVSSDWKNVETVRMEDDEWLALVRRTLKRWPKHQVVLVDIHC